MAAARCTLALAMAVAVACSDSKPKDEPRAEAPAASDWQVDLDYLAAELPARHVDLFFRLSQPAFRSRVAALRKRAPAMSDVEVLVELSRIIAAIGDGHTRTDALQRFDRVPLRLMWFDEGLYVVGVATEHAWAHGRRVVRVGTRDIDDVIADVTALIPHDNESHLRGQLPEYLVAPALLGALGMSAHYTLAADDGTTRTLDLAEATPGADVAWTSGTGTAPPMYLSNPRAHYWNAPIDDAVYLQYNQCANATDVPFARFATGMLAYLDQHRTERVVIDLRHNGGGDSSVIAPLVAGLAARERYRTPGAVAVIIGRHTFSSAVLNALELKSKLGAVLVGEPTGGKPNHYGEVERLTLPKSGLHVWYSTKKFQLVPGDPDAVAPDVPVPVTASAFFSGADPALRAALSAR